MTKSTDSKNIKKIVQGLLNKHEVDNLTLEIDLVSVWLRYLHERENGETPGETRTRISEEFGALGFAGISEDALERARMTQTIMDSIGVDVNEDNALWAEVISHCLRQEKKGETIQMFREWMDTDPFNSPKKHQIAIKPTLIKETWRSAFEGVVSSSEIVRWFESEEVDEAELEDKQRRTQAHIEEMMKKSEEKRRQREAQS